MASQSVSLGISLRILMKLATLLPFSFPLILMRAQARFWAHFIDNKLHVAGIKTVWYKTKEELEEAEKEMIDCLKVVEDELGEKAYFGGETVGYVDVVLAGFCSWFSVYHELGSFSIHHQFPKLMAWTQRCMQRDSFSKSLPHHNKLRDFVLRFRKLKDN